MRRIEKKENEARQQKSKYDVNKDAKKQKKEERKKQHRKRQ